MESFANAAKLPNDPVYDLPSWLEHNYPQYDASPKSPLYSWIVWMRENLPLDKQRSMVAFHEYMQSGKFRPAILRQSNYVSVAPAQEGNGLPINHALTRHVLGDRSLECFSWSMGYDRCVHHGG